MLGIVVEDVFVYIVKEDIMICFFFVVCVIFLVFFVLVVVESVKFVVIDIEGMEVL